MTEGRPDGLPAAHDEDLGLTYYLRKAGGPETSGS